MKEKRQSFQFRVIDLGVGLYIKMNHCMVKRKETRLSGFDWRGIIVMNRNEFSWWIWGNGLNRDYNLMRMKGSGYDCNCETLTRDDVSDIGVRPNELGLRIQGNSRFTWSLSHTQVIGRDQENETESTDHFISQTNSWIDSISQEVAIKQATPSVKRESILFSRSSVHSTTKVILRFHNVKASDTPIPQLIWTMGFKWVITENKDLHSSIINHGYWVIPHWNDWI